MDYIWKRNSEKKPERVLFMANTKGELYVHFVRLIGFGIFLFFLFFGCAVC